MNKNLKNKVLSGAIAVLLIGGSFAYFTDVKTASTAAKAGEVKLILDDHTDEETVMAPGDSKNIVLQATYNGVDAKVRVRLHGNGVNGTTATTGFVVLNADDEAIDLTDDFVINAANASNGDRIVLNNYKIKLLEASPNVHQNEKFELTATIEVLQDAHTSSDWKSIGSGTITAGEDIEILANTGQPA